MISSWLRHETSCGATGTLAIKFPNINRIFCSYRIANCELLTAAVTFLSAVFRNAFRDFMYIKTAKHYCKMYSFVLFVSINIGRRASNICTEFDIFVNYNWVSNRWQ